MSPSQNDKIPFRENIIAALSDEPRVQNFNAAMHYLREKRSSVLPSSDDFELLRKQCKAIKQNALKKLPTLLEKLEDQLQKNGIQVHWAQTPDEANQIILSICEEANAKLVVKGKSMVTEEIGLNHFLEKQGIEAVESDMGEFIVQLAQETPSHIIMPAVHKTKEEIAQLFKQQFPEMGYTDNVDRLIEIGRQILRNKFEQADVGISGVNFAVAETGTLVLVENEGNGRMSTTVPPVHIAVTGIEKVVENLSDIPPLLNLLTRSATGQIITTYVNMISSPRKPEEKDGPQAVHLVLVDNGRSSAYQHDITRQTLQCIRCGACMNHCPVYSRVGGHAYQTVYPGPIGKIVSPHMMGIEKTKELSSASTLCGACEDVCPVGIPITEILKYWRSKEANQSQGEQRQAAPDTLRPQQKIEGLLWNIWAHINTHKHYPVLLKLLTRIRRAVPLGFAPWSRFRARPAIAPKSLHELMAQKKNCSGQAASQPTKSMENE